jgi:hypothetical protein
LRRGTDVATLFEMQALVLFTIATFSAAAVVAQTDARLTDSQPCRPTGPVVKMAGLSEVSGIAASRRTPGTLWAVIDSGSPVLYSLSAGGSVKGQVRLTGADVDDWEAVTIGPCPGGSCLYIGDIGDNNASRKHVTIYRLPEPGAADASSAASDAINATYPDGPHDAEALFASEGALYLVTKGDKEPVALYRFPRDLPPGASVQLERVGKPREPSTPSRDARVTDAAASPNGDWVVLRTAQALNFHRTRELLAGNWQPAHVVDIGALKEPQGEGVTFDANNSIVVAGEGGGKSAPGTFARLTCPSLR